MNGIWITWEYQRRNKGICQALGFPLYEIVLEGPRLIRYIRSLKKTIISIAEHKPNVVVAQNPSILLACSVVILKRIFGYKAVIDCHNSGIYPLEGKSKILLRISSWIQRCADLIIITNDALKEIVQSNRGRAFVLPDKIPKAPNVKKIMLSGSFNIAFICTYSDDEPYMEVIKSASKLPRDVYLYITGNWKGKIVNTNLCYNLKLLGYLLEDNYWTLLESTDLIMDFTLRENCLVCGAYEGISLRKPLILSDTSALREYFYKGCVFARPNATAIADAVKFAIQNYTRLSKEISDLKDELESSWKLKEKALDTLLARIIYEEQ